MLYLYGNHIVGFPTRRLKFYYHAQLSLSRDASKLVFGVSDQNGRSNTNRAVQVKKMARGWKIQDLESRRIVQSVAKTNVLISFAVTG